MMSSFYAFAEANGKTVRSFKVSTAGERKILLDFADGSALTVSLDLGFTAHAQYKDAGQRRKRVKRGSANLRLV